ncbi:MAG: hypothetical protein K6G26_00280 [Lachnospiraceae bacterium]|nr:hypothetical protein [Lachnospiraceae bacterium]
MDNYYEKINDLVIGLLVPARTEKKIDSKVYDKFCEILINLAKDLKGKEYISIKLAGLLFMIETSLSAEASYCEPDDEVFCAYCRISRLIENIFNVS